MKPILAVCLCLLSLAASACQPNRRPVTPADRQAVYDELRRRDLLQPQSLVLESNGFIVADYQLSPAELRMNQPLSAFGRACLLAIREALLTSGYKDYRVNVNGLPPGTGLTQRYGSARFIDAGGTVEWLTP